MLKTFAWIERDLPHAVADGRAVLGPSPCGWQRNFVVRCDLRGQELRNGAVRSGDAFIGHLRMKKEWGITLFRP
jgi:hypothetical protein